MTLEMPTADRVTFGLGLPQAAFDGVDAPALLQLAQSAEGGGLPLPAGAARLRPVKTRAMEA